MKKDLETLLQNAYKYADTILDEEVLILHGEWIAKIEAILHTWGQG